MIHATHAVYKNEEKPDGFVGSIATKDTFCIVEIASNYTKEEGKVALEHLKNAFSLAADPQILDNKIRQFIREGILPSSITLALGIVNQNSIYLKTFGTAQIWLRRATNFIPLIKGNHSATGPIYPGDTLVFTSESFVNSIDAQAVSSFVDHSSLHEAIHELTLFMKDKVLSDAIALVVRFSQSTHSVSEVLPVQTQTATVETQSHIPAHTSMPQQEEPSVNPVSPVKKKFFSLPQFGNVREMLQTGKKNRIITFALVFLIIVILVWSVGFGYKRRQTAQAMEKISKTKEIVNQKLNQSDEVSFLNPQRSLILINEARGEVETLKKSVGDDYAKDVSELDAMIKTREDQITHKENKSGEEFYDLTLDNKNAVGSKFSLDQDMLSVLDTKNGSVYSLSLTKKSLDKQQAKEAKSSSIILRYEDISYVFGQSQGLYKIDTDGKVSKVIDSDTDWGSVVSIEVYNGNLYFLDSSKNQIYKYVPTESGYSEKSTYIKSDSSVQGASSLAIDSSVYAAVGDHIMKFTAGGEDEFKTVFPEDGVKLKKVITNKDLEKVYAWDKDAGIVFILAKNGTYERQVKSSTFAQADDVIIYNNAAYALVKEKIFKVSVQ